jgi:hypothetical protein
MILTAVIVSRLIIDFRLGCPRLRLRMMAGHLGLRMRGQRLPLAVHRRRLDSASHRRRLVDRGKHNQQQKPGSPAEHIVQRIAVADRERLLPI